MTDDPPRPEVHDARKQGVFRGKRTRGDARIEGSVADDSVTGTVTISDAGPFAFTAVPSDGVTGLYTLRAKKDGTVRGSSAGGTSFRGSPEGDHVAITLTLPDGTTREFEETMEGEHAAGLYRAIITSDGHIVGGGATSTSLARVTTVAFQVAYIGIFDPITF